jgi:DNA-binding NarL/FixJ family response regulator
MKIRVLIADDAPFIHEVLKSYLGRFEIEIIGHAYDGEEMVSMVLEKQPDLVFADMAMPKLNGIDASRKVLDQIPHLQIIAMTSMPGESIIAEAIAAGCVDFIDKSFPVDHMGEAIESVRAKILGQTAGEVVNG